MNLKYETKCKRCNNVILHELSIEDCNISNGGQVYEKFISDFSFKRNHFIQFIARYENKSLRKHCEKCNKITFHDIVSDDCA